MDRIGYPDQHFHPKVKGYGSHKELTPQMNLIQNSDSYKHLWLLVLLWTVFSKYEQLQNKKVDLKKRKFQQLSPCLDREGLI